MSLQQVSQVWIKNIGMFICLGNEFWALGLVDHMITFLGVHLLPNLSPVVELENSQMSI